MDRATRRLRAWYSRKCARKERLGYSMTERRNGKGAVLLAGATGAIGQQLLPLLVAEGYHVIGTTRDPAKSDQILAQGGTPAVLDILNREEVGGVIVRERPKLIIDQITDLSNRD